jgi:hypothetical protein
MQSPDDRVFKVISVMLESKMSAIISEVKMMQARQE